MSILHHFRDITVFKVTSVFVISPGLSIRDWKSNLHLFSDENIGNNHNVDQALVMDDFKISKLDRFRFDFLKKI